MTSAARPTSKPLLRRGIVIVHQWLGLGAATFWLLQAVTGILLVFHFEADDMLRSVQSAPTDKVAIQTRLDQLADAGGKAKVNWIWTTAGLPDRYQISYSDAEGTDRKLWIDGGGGKLHDTRADDFSFLALIREIHIDLLSGNTGQWIMAVTGALLATNILSGLYLGWPRRQRWRAVLKPVKSASRKIRYYSWHRAVGLWAAVPALIVVATGTMILFEHGIRDLINAPENELPAITASTPIISWEQASEAAESAIPGSHFVGNVMPEASDASYYFSVHAPGELYRGGYGASLVIVDARDASIRAVFDATKADTKQAFVNSFYPLHTGEAAGLVGRILALAIGLWLATTVVLGLLLWWNKRRRKDAQGVNSEAVDKA
jgi:uncharacterized iron-regulated membrane protein